MAQLTLDLTQFKSAGVYTLEIDETTSYSVETNALRLLVGFSSKGPFNKPVFLRDEDDAEKIFGKADEKLEHKGSYFNRFADTLARRTPIFALNLLKVDETYEGPDQVNYAALSLDAGKPNPAVNSYNKRKYGETDYTYTADALIYSDLTTTNPTIPYVGNTPYSSLFDRSRFWNPSDENLLATVANGLPTSDKVTFEHTNFLNFANLSTGEISLLIFKPENLSGYSLTCNEWYDGIQNIPYGFIRPYDYVEDYFIQVVAVKGCWSNYKMLATDTVWSEFFDEKGIKKGKINSFISSAGVTLIGSWQGSIIPGFQNKAGEYLDIVEKINKNTDVTGVLASFNKDAAQVLKFDYDGELQDDGTIDLTKRGWFIDDDGDDEWNTGESSADNTYLIDMVGHNFQKGYTGADMTPRFGINFLSYTFDTDDKEELLTYVTSAHLFNSCGTDANGKAPVISDIKNLFIVTNPDEAAKLAIGDFVNNDSEDTTVIPGLTRIIKKNWITLASNDSFTKSKSAQEVDVYGATFTYKGTIYNYTGKAIYDSAFGKLGFYLFTTVESVEILSKTEEDSSSSSSSSEEITYVTKQAKLSDSTVSANYKFIPLKGLSITKRHIPGYDENGNIDVEAGIEKIYSMLADEGIERGLCNPQMISFRYIIDSMSHGIAPMLGGKVYLSQLAKKKKMCTAILNAPSKREFARSVNPYFCDTFIDGVDVKPAFNTEYIAKGGNEDLYSANTFSLPDEDNGASFTGVFYPNLTYTVNGKKVSVPPAADVSNVLIRKYLGGDTWAICANNNGIISNGYLSGVECALDTQDRDSLEPFGINSIITRNSNIMIYGNQTAYQRVKSDLNKLHIRENLNTLEISCDAVLQNYPFLYNNAQTRANIVQKLTPILRAAQTSGAIDSYSIVCDDTNNTEDVISADYGLVDIEVTMAHGMEKIVQRFTLTRNGTTQS